MGDIIFNVEGELICGQDTINRAGGLCARHGSRALAAAEEGLLDGPLRERLACILKDAGVEAIVFDEAPSGPGLAAAEAIAALARGARCASIIALGGAAFLSAARLAAILARSSLDAWALLEGRADKAAPLPLVTAPVGEADPFLCAPAFPACDPRDRSPVLIAAPRGLSAGAVFDPGLCPPGGPSPAALFDGLSVAAEACCSAKNSFISAPILEAALAIYGKLLSAPKEADGGDSGDDQEDFAALSSQAALLASLGAGASSPGAVCAISWALHYKSGAPRASCAAALLPGLLSRLASVRPEETARAAALIGAAPPEAPPAEAAPLAAAFVRERLEAAGLPPRLGAFTVPLDRMIAVAEAARKLPFTASSPWTVTAEDAYGLLKDAF